MIPASDLSPASTRRSFSLSLKDEMRIKDSRMAGVSAQRRPHYLPIERLAVLELRAARGWSQAQTSVRMQITPATVAAWTSRLDEEGPGALIQMREPVNRFPDFVAHVVLKLKVLCPATGKVRIAQFLARAGLHLGSTTVARNVAGGAGHAGRWSKGCAISMPVRLSPQVGNNSGPLLPARRGASLVCRRTPAACSYPAGCGTGWWRRRESNPRPEMIHLESLHA